MSSAVMQEERSKIKTDAIDIRSLINVMLLGKNSKKIRIASAHLLKALFESNEGLRTQIFQDMIRKLGSLKSYGVNTEEFLAAFSSICLISF